MNKNYIIYIIAIAVISYFVYSYINKKPETPETPETPDVPNVPVNDGTYPDWVNKDYSPNTTVYWNGLLYRTMTNVYGNNNNTPDHDGRWSRI